MPAADYPSFDVALERFRDFASAQGAPTEVLFVSPKDVVILGGELYVRRPDAKASRAVAARRYQAISRQLGVVLSGRCTLGDHLCAYVYGPADEDEAARLMFPDGLKISVLQPLPTASAANGLTWAMLRVREFASENRRWKNESFK